jgi:hypothetical protein
MAWIESHTHLLKHHKVLRMASSLSIRPVEVIGHLHCLWHNVLELREDGDISMWTPKEVAFYSQFEGDVNKFYEALKDGWLDQRNGYVLVHDWLEYSGRYLQGKYRTHQNIKWETIRKKHLVSPVGQSDHTDNLPNQTLPNQPTTNNTVSKEAYLPVLDYWNISGLPVCKALTSMRREKLNLRWKSQHFRDNYKTAIEKLGKSSFAKGASKTGWKASIDWFITNDTNYVKALEGKYDDKIDRWGKY